MVMSAARKIRNTSAMHRYPATRVHAPMAPPTMTLPDNPRYAYCVEFGDDTVKVAKRGETVNCKLCLKKLGRVAQYANFLQRNGINTRGF
jgi:hypothetical protein